MTETQFEHIKWEISGARLLELERKEKELSKAQELIRRLRAKNNALKTEHAAIYERMKIAYSKLGDNFTKRYGAIVMMRVFRKSTID